MTKSTRRSAPKKITRTRSIDRCVAEGEKYLERTKEKRIIKTRAVTRAINQAKKAEEARKERATPKPKVAKKYPRKRPVRPARPSLPALPPPLNLFPVAPPKVQIGFFSGGKPAVSNTTVFAKSSIPAEDLAMPAFGFIDVCFCLDATFSMYSELAQVKSTISSLIKKI